MKTIFLLAASLSIVSAQELRVTAAMLSDQTTTAMFGRLPKGYQTAATGICNQTGERITAPLVLVAQQLKLTHDITVLPHDAAFAVIAAAQGSSKSARAFRIGVALVSLAALASSWTELSQTWKNVLNSAAISGGQAVNIVATAIPTHTYLTFDHVSLPDPLTLGAAGTVGSCANGIALIEAARAARTIDFMLSIPLPAK